MSTELVLVISDILVPTKSPSINEQFKSILLPNKITHILCLGNIGNQDTLYWLQNLSPDLHIVKGDYDIYKNYPEKKTIQIGSFRLGMIHGHQLLPPDDLNALLNIQHELDCDVLLSGYTYKYNISVNENKLFLNPGSIIGGLSPLMEDCAPSFILMAITGEEMIIYSYVLTDKNEKFQVGQIEYIKGSNELKIIKEIKFDEDDEIEDNKNNNNNENNINNEKENIENDKEIKEKENNINNEEKKNEEKNNNIITDEQEKNNQELILENKPQIQIDTQNIKEEEQANNNNEIKEDKLDE